MNAASFWGMLDSLGFRTMRILLSVLWQSSILFVTVALLACALRRRRAAVRHGVWIVALLVAPALPLLAWAASSFGTPQARIPVMPSYSAPTVQYVAPPVELYEPAPVAPVPAPPVEVRASLADYPWALALLGYAAGVTLLATLILVGRLRIRSWLRTGRTVTDPRVLAALAAARERRGLNRNLALLESESVPTPMTVGTFRPSVLLPAGLAQRLSDAELRAVAVHELAHVRRKDALLLSLVSLVRAALFFHPLVWLGARQVSTLAEAACDDAVLDAGGEPVSYAKMLARLAEELPRRSISTELAAGIVLSKSAFLRRVEAILSDRRDRIRRLSRLALAATLLGGLVSLGIALALPLGERSPTTDATEAPLEEAIAAEGQGMTDAAALIAGTAEALAPGGIPIFGLVIERVLPAGGVVGPGMFDVDRARIGRAGPFSPRRNDVQMARAIRDRMREFGADFATLDDPGEAPAHLGRGLVAADLEFVVAGPGTWWDAAPETYQKEVALCIQVQRQPPRMPIMVTAPSFDEVLARLPADKPERQASYIFQTREGGMGILQIVGFTDDPPGVKIRYKMVQGEPKAIESHPEEPGSHQAWVELSGRVIDEQTGEPIEHYGLQWGWPDPKDPSKVGWGSINLSSRRKDGRFSQRRGWIKGRMLWVRVLADGYLPQPVTPQPVTAPVTLEDLEVALERGLEVRGRVMDHSGKAVAGAQVFLGGNQRVELVDGEAQLFAGSKTVTDADGRFAVSGAGAGLNSIVVSAQWVHAWVEPTVELGQELTVRLPEPAVFVAQYEIEGDDPQASIRLELKTWEMESWKGVAGSTQTLAVQNKSEAVLNNVTPGVYDLARMKNLRVGDMGSGVLCDRQTITLQPGKTKLVGFVRKAGCPILGEVVGLQGKGVPGAFIFVKPAEATGDPYSRNEWKLTTFDALTCELVGRFKTALIPPGHYTVIAEAYRPEPRTGVIRLGRRLPDFIGTAKVTVPKDGEPPHVRIVLKPRGKQQEAPPKTTPAEGESAKGLSFGPVIERVVGGDGSGKDMFIDLDRGELFSKNFRGSLFPQQIQSLRDSGVDALGATDPEVSGLVGIELIVHPVPKKHWNRNDAGELVEREQLWTYSKPGFPVWVTAKGELPATFIFKTREGGIGILQIVGFAEDPPGVKIRYKMVRASAQEAVAGQQEAQEYGFTKFEGAGGGGIGGRIGGGGAFAGGFKEPQIPGEGGPRVLIELKLSEVTEAGEKVLSAPRITVADRKTGYLSATTERHYVRGLPTPDAPRPEIGQVDTGVSFEVTPRMQKTAPDTIAVTILAKLRYIEGRLVGVGPKEVPVVGSREWQTTVLLKDGVPKTLSIIPTDVQAPSYKLEVTAKVLTAAAAAQPQREAVSRAEAARRAEERAEDIVEIERKTRGQLVEDLERMIQERRFEEARQILDGLQLTLSDELVSIFRDRIARAEHTYVMDKLNAARARGDLTTDQWLTEKDALDQIGELTGMAWKVAGGVFKIAAPESLRDYDMRLYNVRDLLVSTEDVTAWPEAGRPGRPPEGGGLDTLTDRTENLILLIKQACGEGTWMTLPPAQIPPDYKGPGGRAFVHPENPGHIVIVQTAEVHECIERLLRKLRGDPNAQKQPGYTTARTLMYPDKKFWKEVVEQRGEVFYPSGEVFYPSAEIFKRVQEEDRRVYEQLQEKVKLSFDATPLEQVVDFLQQITTPSYVLLRQDLPPDGAPVTLHVDTTLKDALDRICELTGMAWKVDGGVIKIGAPESLRDYDMRIYNIRDLLISVEDLYSGGGGGYGGGQGGRAENLILLIKQACGEGTWMTLPPAQIPPDYKGPRGRAFIRSTDAGDIIIVQTAEVHQCIERLLRKLRVAMRVQVELHVKGFVVRTDTIPKDEARFRRFASALLGVPENRFSLESSGTQMIATAGPLNRDYAAVSRELIEAMKWHAGPSRATVSNGTLWRVPWLNDGTLRPIISADRKHVFMELGFKSLSGDVVKVPPVITTVPDRGVLLVVEHGPLAPGIAAQWVGEEAAKELRLQDCAIALVIRPAIVIYGTPEGEIDNRMR